MSLGHGTGELPPLGSTKGDADHFEAASWNGPAHTLKKHSVRGVHCRLT